MINPMTARRRTAEPDTVDHFIAAWNRECPALDPSPMAVIGRLHRLGAIFDTLLRPPFAEAGLGPNDFDVLAALRRSGAPYRLSPGGLAAAVMITSGAITKRVDRLETLGLVDRVVSPEDGRGRIIGLTEQGRALTEKLAASHWANEDRLLAALDPQERDQLAGLLRRLLLAHE